ncbi:PSD1 and planctomycete cytochrome C domain-containing protein [Roseiconus lacunae]|uniref:PSD1 and planctomycete cytochrome C domain-containing protein n=1 Tax=Roseiconus lacunae TaxID=2605694 RepID=UPI001E33B89B|nr:PSD1 and planctomycete cytochrome C domain-containing protein [Roseiconus lacunae]
MHSNWLSAVVRVCVLILIPSMLAVGNDTTVLDLTQVEFFEKEVRPLLIEHCLDCHGGDEADGGLSLDSFDRIMKGGDSGAAAVPGDISGSLMIEAVRYQSERLRMPPSGKLTDPQIKVFERWVELGLPDPRKPMLPEEPPPQTVAGNQTSDPDAIESFWSFQPIRSVPLPGVKDSDWVKTPIDRFVLAKLEANRLQPAPAADRRTLIRRVYHDLVGLPPTPEQIDAFLTDQSDEAFTKVVDELLQSPSYGVRWGRHWLDVARYADSNGLDENLAFGNAWRYRDYVVDSFNRDKPFDQFVIEQIAGDLVPGATTETISGTGFLVLGAKVLAEPDREKLMMDTIDEQIDTIGKAFMGMTLGCVRCHDHKFDPLTQEDYYALAAIFKSTQTFADSRTGAIKHWYEHSLVTQDQLAVFKQVDSEIQKAKQAAASYKSTQINQLRQEARTKATEYLVACTMIDPQQTLIEIQSVAERFDLHSRVLHHCRRHLEFHRDDAVFVPWHSIDRQGLSQQARAEEVRSYYQPLFQAASAVAKPGSQEQIDADSDRDALIQQARTALNDATGFLAIPAKPEYAFTPDVLAEYHRLMEVARKIESNAPDEPAVMAVSEMATEESIPIHIRGSHLNLGEDVKREFPAVLRFSDVRPIFPSNQSGRLQLARWIASSRHALTSRVFVNRVWGWHFGVPLVKTTENFGLLGDRPSHPELLDWLAIEWMRSGWSVKQLHRMIVLSATYQMRSDHPDVERIAVLDPENRMHSHANVQRLSAESIRDSLLSVSGLLNQELGGKTVPLRNRQFVFDHTSVDHTTYETHRRAAYLPIIRNNLCGFLSQFDYPDPTTPTGHRSQSVVAPQALLMMNHPLVIEAASHWASQMRQSKLTDQQRVERSYLAAFGRPPEPNEVRRAIDFLTQSQLSPQQAWVAFCQSLLAANEFIYLR